MNISLRQYRKIGDIPAMQWQSLITDEVSPFMTWDWLQHLEASGSVSRDTGWEGCHLTLWNDTQLIAAAPLYLRSHNVGEFVFDYMWQEVADHYEIPYQPKLVGMSPLTPVAAYQFLFHPAVAPEPLYDLIFSQIVELSTSLQLGVVQFNYVTPSFLIELTQRGWLAWQHQGYRLQNVFHHFDDYLQSFNKNQRRNIRRERQAMQNQGLQLQILPSLECPPHFFSLMAEYYRNTNQKFGIWAAHYLRDDFFLRMPASLKSKLFFAAAFAKDDTPIALALLVKSQRALYGRYWGAAVSHHHLHFNLCYYLPIQWMIAEKLSFFDPGIGAEHKTRRGFTAIALYSCHKFQHEGFHQFFKDNIGKINQSEQAYMRELNSHIPYKAT